MAVDRINQKHRWRLRNIERKIILLFGDLLVSAISLIVALYFWGQKDWLEFSWTFMSQRAPLWFYLLPFVWVITLIELYDLRKATHRKETLKGITIAAGISLLLYLFVFFISEPNSLPRRGVAIFLVCTTILTFLWRLLYIQIFTAPTFLRKALVVGAGKAGTTFCHLFVETGPLPFRLIGFVDDDPEKLGTQIENLPVLGKGEDLSAIIEQQGVTDVVLAISGELRPDLFQELLSLAETGVEITSVPVIYEELFGRVPIFLLQSDWILRSFIDQSRTTGMYESAKRLIDIVGGLVGSLALLVFLPLIALAILLDDGFPIFYLQNRVGMNGRPYKMIKIRTMVKDAEKDGVARMTRNHDSRITRAGKLLRKSHLDELPQFLNILKGDMSLVGPRSEQIELVRQFQDQLPFYRARLFVRPGLTGWAQINQPYAANVEDTGIKLEYDLYYIKHRNLMLDFTIILRTVGAVIGFKGI